MCQCLLLVLFDSLEASFLKVVLLFFGSLHCVGAMSFSDEELLRALEGIPSDGFLAESSGVRLKWLHFVASVDPDPKSLHDVLFLHHCRKNVS